VLGSRTDSPPARSLSYFQVDPCARSDPKDRFLQCPISPPAATGSDGRIRTELRKVGDVGSFGVYDLVYLYGDATSGTRPIQLRSVLVKVGPDSFREVHVQEANGAVLPTAIMQAGQQRIIMVKSEDGGMYRIVYEDYFFLTSGGLQRLDFEPVVAAAEKAVPKDEFTYQPTTSYGLGTLVYSIGTEKKGKNVSAKVGCCDGRIEVPFKIENGKLIPGKAKYTPSFF
jgi:hypothetical protein